MQAKLAEIVGELEADPPTCPTPTELERGTAFLRWLGDDHFAFLGYREYSLVEEGDELALSAVPGTGLGILRGDQLQSAAFQKLPEAVRERARSRACWCWPRPTPRRPCTDGPTSTTSASRSSTRTTRSWGSAASSGCSPSATYTESVLRIPVLKEKVDEVLERRRHRAAQPHRQAAAQRAGELPARRAVPDPDRRADPDRRGRDADPRAPPAAAVRTPRHLPPLRLLPGLPAARPLQHRGPRADGGDPAPRRSARESVEFTVRLNEAYMAQVHFVVRPPEGELISEIDTHELERRLTDAARSWRDDLTSAITADFGEEHGARLARALRRRVPRGLQGGLRRADRVGRHRPARGASRSAPTGAASTCRSTRRSTPAAARPG